MELCFDTWKLDESAAHLCLTVVSQQAWSVCRLCRTPYTHVHSRYEHPLANLPCGGSTVIWKSLCRQAQCKRRVFTERLKAAIAPIHRDTRGEYQDRLDVLSKLLIGVIEFGSDTDLTVAFAQEMIGVRALEIIETIPDLLFRGIPN